MRVTAIGGLPASGKTSLMRAIMQRLNEKEIGIYFKEGLVTGTDYGDTVILGDYNNPADKFAGTDRLSMAAQPKVLEWLGTGFVNNTKHAMFEGDRLFNLSFFRHLETSNIPFRIYILLADPNNLWERCQARGSNQAPSFIKGRMTKIERIAKALPVTILDNDTLEQQQQNMETILNGKSKNGKDTTT